MASLLRCREYTVASWERERGRNPTRALPLEFQPVLDELLTNTTGAQRRRLTTLLGKSGARFVEDTYPTNPHYIVTEWSRADAATFRHALRLTGSGFVKLPGATLSAASDSQIGKRRLAMSTQRKLDALLNRVDRMSRIRLAEMLEDRKILVEMPVNPAPFVVDEWGYIEVAALMTGCRNTCDELAAALGTRREVVNHWTLGTKKPSAKSAAALNALLIRLDAMPRARFAALLRQNGGSIVNRQP